MNLGRKVKVAKPAEPDSDDGLVPELRNVFGYLLRASHGCYQNYWATKFRESDTPITPVQGGMLIVISHNPGLTQTALAKIMNVEGPTLMQSVDRLEKNGYIRRARFVDDRRSYALLLTELGRTVLQAALQFLPERDEVLLADLNAEERGNLALYLQRIITRSRKIASESPEQGGSQIQAANPASPITNAAPRPRPDSGSTS